MVKNEDKKSKQNTEDTEDLKNIQDSTQANIENEDKTSFQDNLEMAEPDLEIDYQQKIEALQAKAEELNDKYLRLFSEFDNYRKRTLKEKIEYSKMASAEAIAALLPVFDDLARACELAENSPEDESFAKGIFLIYSKFKSILSQKGVEEITALGDDFNTDFHEAISNVEAMSDEQKGKVIEEVEKGYLLHGKVLRFAKVIVAN